MKRGGPHRARPALRRHIPVHISLRTMRGVPRLRQRCMYDAIRRVLVRYVDGAEFRITHISLQHNHIHLIVEASDEHELTRGMQSFAINVARAVNAAWGREGKVFAHRYHASQIKNAQYARNAIAYVLNNWRRHREDFRNGNQSSALLDRYSSAISFDGWTIRFGPAPPDYEPLPVSAPRTRMLQSSWTLFGFIDPMHRPAAMS